MQPRVLVPLQILSYRRFLPFFPRATLSWQLTFDFIHMVAQMSIDKRAHWIEEFRELPRLPLDVVWWAQTWKEGRLKFTHKCYLANSLGIIVNQWEEYDLQLPGSPFIHNCHCLWMSGVSVNIEKWAVVLLSIGTHSSINRKYSTLPKSEKPLNLQVFWPESMNEFPSVHLMDWLLLHISCAP